MAQFTSHYFPHVDLLALQTFAAEVAAREHTIRLSRNAGLERLTPHSRGKAPIRKKKDNRPYPQVVDVRDTIYAGEKTILLTFAAESIPLGPRQMIAHFPRGRPTLTTKALVGMTLLASKVAKVATPKIFGYYDNVANPIKAEVVLMETAQGDNLAEVFHKLSLKKQKIIVEHIADILLRLFACRCPVICSVTTDALDVSPRPESGLDNPRPSVLLARPFEEGALANKAPMGALTSTYEYLRALSTGPERVFFPVSPGSASRDVDISGAVSLMDKDHFLVFSTWRRLGSLINFHTGGFYLPGHLSLDARVHATSILQSREFGIRHTDLRLSRIFVRWDTPEDEHSHLTLTITGWEHGHTAPLWSCARMPPWLVPHLHLNEDISWERQAILRRHLFRRISSESSWRSLEWTIAYIFGQTERWFEGMLSSPWAFRDTNEVLLMYLRNHWQLKRPDVPFPLPVGGVFLAGLDLPELRGLQRPDIRDNVAIKRWLQDVRARFAELARSSPAFMARLKAAKALTIAANSTSGKRPNETAVLTSGGSPAANLPSSASTGSRSASSSADTGSEWPRYSSEDLD